MEEVIQVEGEFYLRPLKNSDAVAFQEAFAEEESARFFTQQRLQGFRDAKVLIEWLCESGEYYTIVRQRDSRVIGIIGISEREEVHSVYRISYMIFKEHRGRGVAPKVIRALTAACMKRDGVRRIEAAIRPDNIKSLRCIEKAGYIMSGMIDAEPGSEHEGALAKRILYIYE